MCDQRGSLDHLQARDKGTHVTSLLFQLSNLISFFLLVFYVSTSILTSSLSFFLFFCMFWGYETGGQLSLAFLLCIKPRSHRFSDNACPFVCYTWFAFIFVNLGMIEHCPFYFFIFFFGGETTLDFFYNLIFHPLFSWNGSRQSHWNNWIFFFPIGRVLLLLSLFSP